ncbi:hypothetical protein [Phnomibacter sp. MR]|uniref:hypothetical protein n=1 Tax=Phnomibacter sp. MR TaxID=3042318 RepID=UPI003A813557
MSKLVLFLSAIAISSGAAAQWNPDATVNNRVVNVTGTKADLYALPDGSGGMYLTWTDSRNSATTGTDIYFQRILNNGTLAFDSAGILVCNAAGSQSSPSLVMASSGAVIIAWVDARTTATTSNDVYAQKINANGTVAWAENGVAISTASGNQNSPSMAEDGAGGAVMVFQDTRNTATTGIDLYAQRINGSGVVQWTTDGVMIVNQPNSQSQQVIVPDGAGSYYLAWNDSRLATTNSGIYAQKINNAGEIQWEIANQGVAVCTAANNQVNPQITLGNGGNVFITWADLRAGLSNLTDVYVQMLNSSGAKQFTDTEGLLVCNAANNQTNPYIIGDGNGNAIITWADQRAGTATASRDIYAQKINSAGTVAWAANGVAVCTDAGTQPNSGTDGFKIVSDGSGGAIVTWDDARDGTSNLHVYAQRIDADGNALWPLGSGTKAPIPVANGAANQRIPVMVSDNNSGAIVAFADSRNGTNLDIFASRLFSNGTLPVNSISLSGIEKNKTALLTWKTMGEQDVQRFELQRSNANGQWITIASLPAKTGNGNNIYNHTDDKPFAGNNFYRVKIIDRNGNISNSETVRVAVPVKSGKVLVSPVPANSSLQVTLLQPTTGNYLLKLVDANGRIAQQQSVTFTAAVQQMVVPVQVQSLAAGMYRLVVSAQDGSIVASLPVQKQ